MRIIRIILFLFFISNIHAFGYIQPDLDKIKIDSLNTKAYELRLMDAEKTIQYSQQALKASYKLNYSDGIAESFRVKGIGLYYLDKRDSAISYYFKSLSKYEETNNQLGKAKVLNNIGNLYFLNDNNKALDYYRQSLDIAIKFDKKDLIAGSYMNISNAYLRKKEYALALQNIEKSRKIFKELNNSIGLTQIYQNQGVIYFALSNYGKAEKSLLKAHALAKKNGLNNSIAAIDISLTDIYIIKKNYVKAEYYIKEGTYYAELIKSESILRDFLLTSYEMESKRKNYFSALYYLKQVHNKDSANYTSNIASIIQLSEEQNKQQQIQKENELNIERQKRINTLFIATIAIALLAFIVIFLLIRSKRITEKSNKDLHLLNNEVSRQKENVDKINHKLEEIIAERTKDLLSKNQKLSEYSSHLSHQIRGPVATLKGLVMLSQDNLIEEKECIGQMRKCVDDIDQKIMDINIALHDPDRHGLSAKS